MTLSKFALIILSLNLVAACGQQTENVATNEAIAEEPTVQSRIVRNGYGRTVEAGDSLSVHTTGWLHDESMPDSRGEKFWSSLDEGERLEFTLGAGQMIKGWDQGIPGMLIGEIRELTIPSNLAYGDAGRGPIPPGATLVFEIELFGADGPADTQ